MTRWLTVVLAVLFLSGCGGAQTDRAKDGLRGRVKTVKTELAKISTNPHYVEGIRTLLTQVTYDQKGLRLQASCYWADKSPIGTPVALVDGQGRKVELAPRYKDGTVDSKILARFDSDGKPTEELLFDTDGSIGSRTTFVAGEIQGIVGALDSPKWVYTYDKGNRKLKKLLYDADKTLLLKSTYAYDGKGRLMEVASYRDHDEVLLGKWAYGYEDKSRKAEVRFYGSDAYPLCTWRYRYEVDPKGNWTRRMAERLAGEAWTLTEVVYREITYWGRR